MESTYDKIKAIADERKIPIATIERESGLGNGVIAGWRDGKPSAVCLFKVSKFLGVTMESLMSTEATA